MKITEIFGSPNIIVTKHQKQSLNAEPYLRSRIDKAESRGTKRGGFGVVLPHSTDVATVTKNNPRAYLLEDDPYYLFVKYVYKNNLAEDNLYLPRVYGITQTMGKYKRVIYNIDMEELIELSQINAEEIKAVLLKMGAESDWKGYGKTAMLNFLENSIISYGRRKEKYTLKLRNTNNFNVSVTDNKFYEAIDLWRYIKKKNTNFLWDIGKDNLMWRQTSTGKQLVLTDLLSNLYLEMF